MGSGGMLCHKSESVTDILGLVVGRALWNLKKVSGFTMRWLTSLSDPLADHCVTTMYYTAPNKELIDQNKETPIIKLSLIMPPKLYSVNVTSFSHSVYSIIR